MHAVDKVPVDRVDGRRRHGVGRRVARLADDVRRVRVSRHGGADEEVDGKSYREVLRIGEGKEGCAVREVGASVRQAQFIKKRQHTQHAQRQAPPTKVEEESSSTSKSDPSNRV